MEYFNRTSHQPNQEWAVMRLWNEITGADEKRFTRLGYFLLGCTPDMPLSIDLCGGNDKKSLQDRKMVADFLRQFADQIENIKGA